MFQGVPPRRSSTAVERAEPQFLWTRLQTRGQRPPPVCCATACLYKNRYVLTFGGAGSSSLEGQLFCNNRVHCLDLMTNEWRVVETQNSSIVHPRIVHSAVIYKDTMLVYGGHPLRGEMVSFDGVLELDLHTWTWRLLPCTSDGPGERYLHSAVVYGDRMYLIMGWNATLTGLLWYLDLVDYSWHRVPPSTSTCVPSLTLSGHASCLDGDNLYIFGGEIRQSGANTQQTDFYSALDCSYSNTLYCYNIPTNEWTVPFAHSGPSPMGRYCCSMVIADGRLYLFGGDRDGSSVYFGDYWTLDTRQPGAQWVEVGCQMRHGPSDCQRPSKRTGAAAVLAMDAFYLFGGEVGPGQPMLEEERYSNSLYRCPLTLSYTLSLEECAARWLGTTPASTHQAAALFPSLPIAARHRLYSYLPSSEDFMSTLQGSCNTSSEFDDGDSRFSHFKVWNSDHLGGSD